MLHLLKTKLRRQGEIKMEISMLRREQEIFIFSKVSSPALGPNQPPLQCVLGALSSEVKIRVRAYISRVEKSCRNQQMPANVLWYLSTRLHGITSSNTVFIAVIVVRTSTCCLAVLYCVACWNWWFKFQRGKHAYFTTRTSASLATLNILLSAEINWLLRFGTVIENPLGPGVA